MAYVYNVILLTHRKEWNLAICNNMDRAGVYYEVSEVSQKEKNKYCMLTHICRILKKKKKIPKNLGAGQEWRRRCREWTWGHGEGEG